MTVLLCSFREEHHLTFFLLSPKKAGRSLSFWSLLLNPIMFTGLTCLQVTWRELKDLEPCKWSLNDVLELAENTAVMSQIEYRGGRGSGLCSKPPAVVLVFQLLWAPKPFFSYLDFLDGLFLWCSMKVVLNNLCNITTCCSELVGVLQLLRTWRQNVCHKDSRCGAGLSAVWNLLNGWLGIHEGKE